MAVFYHLIINVKFSVERGGYSTMYWWHQFLNPLLQDMIQVCYDLFNKKFNLIICQVQTALMITQVTIMMEMAMIMWQMNTMMWHKTALGHLIFSEQKLSLYGKIIQTSWILGEIIVNWCLWDVICGVLTILVQASFDNLFLHSVIKIGCYSLYV